MTDPIIARLIASIRDEIGAVLICIADLGDRGGMNGTADEVAAALHARDFAVVQCWTQNGHVAWLQIRPHDTDPIVGYGSAYSALDATLDRLLAAHHFLA